MKISINSKFLKEPYGGGMQFANFMRLYLESKGIKTVNDLTDGDIDLILHVNPFPHLVPEASSYSYIDAYKYKLKHPRTIIVERINECDERKNTTHINKLLVKAAIKSDFVVFIASWLRPLMLSKGLDKNKPWKVILNGADESIFNTINKVFWNGEEKIKIVTHHWSNNPKKGHEIYQKLDKLLENDKFKDLFEFTYIGRIPPGLSYKNSRIIDPLAGEELAEELKNHHIYITASENEPAGMHHIEGALCGLPILYINSGALPEYCSGYGLEFNDNNLEEKLLEMREHYLEFREKIKSYKNNAQKMAGEYLSLFQDLYHKRERFTIKKQTPNIKRYIPRFIKYPLIILYILFRCINKGLSSKTGTTLNLAGVLPPPYSNKVVHGGKVKLLALRERFGDTWKKFNIAYFVSSGLPFAPSIWIKLYKLFGIKIVWNQNGVAYPAWAGAKTREINSLMIPMHLSDYVIYQTEFTKKCADKFLGTYAGQSRILVNPVNTEHFKPRLNTLPESQFTIVMSGHHFESKERMTVSLDAVRKIEEDIKNVKLIIIGNTQEVPKEDWIEVMGKFTQEEAPSLYQKAHMLLHLKSLDPCPTIVLEALACGLPVVGLENGGMPELVDSKSGILIPAIENFDQFLYPKPEQVAEAILKIKLDLATFSRNARERSLKFDKKQWLEKHEEIFQKLCQ